MPVITLKKVVLPEPLGPIRPRISPALTARLNWFSATKPPKRMLKLSQVSSVLIGLPWRFAPRIRPWGGPSGSLDYPGASRQGFALGAARRAHGFQPGR